MSLRKLGVLVSKGNQNHKRKTQNRSPAICGGSLECFTKPMALAQTERWEASARFRRLNRLAWTHFAFYRGRKELRFLLSSWT